MKMKPRLQRVSAVWVVVVEAPVRRCWRHAGQGVRGGGEVFCVQNMGRDRNKICKIPIATSFWALYAWNSSKTTWEVSQNILWFSFELYFFSVGGSLLFMKALSHFPAWEFLSKKTLLWFFSNRNHSEGLDGNHNYPSYIWKSCGRGKKCNFHCKSIRKEFCFIIAVVFFLADCSSFQFSCILDRIKEYFYSTIFRWKIQLWWIMSVAQWFFLLLSPKPRSFTGVCGGWPCFNPPVSSSTEILLWIATKIISSRSPIFVDMKPLYTRVEQILSWYFQWMRDTSHMNIVWGP